MNKQMHFYQVSLMVLNRLFLTRLVFWRNKLTFRRTGKKTKKITWKATIVVGKTILLLQID